MVRGKRGPRHTEQSWSEWEWSQWTGQAWSEWDQGAWNGSRAKSSQAWAAWDEAWQEEASVSPQEELQIMAQKAKLIYADLPGPGKKIWKALNQCISSTLSAGAIHFERELRHELETQLGECELTRQAGSQWVLKAGGQTFYASVRSEVLGDQSAQVLTKLRDQARTVKRGLLQGGAEWLRDLANGEQETSDFLDAVRSGWGCLTWTACQKAQERESRAARANLANATFATRAGIKTY